MILKPRRIGQENARTVTHPLLSRPLAFVGHARLEKQIRREATGDRYSREPEPFNQGEMKWQSSARNPSSSRPFSGSRWATIQRSRWCQSSWRMADAASLPPALKHWKASCTFPLATGSSPGSKACTIPAHLTSSPRPMTQHEGCNDIHERPKET